MIVVIGIYRRVFLVLSFPHFYRLSFVLSFVQCKPAVFQSLPIIFALVLTVVQGANAWAVSEVSISIKSITTVTPATSVSANDVAMSTHLKTGATKFSAKQVQAVGADKKPLPIPQNVQIECVKFERLESRNTLQCSDMKLLLDKEAVSGVLGFDIKQHALRAQFVNVAHSTETIDVTAQLGANSALTRIDAAFDGLRLERLKPFAATAKLNAVTGTVKGAVTWQPSDISATIELKDGAFSDDAGLRAGEKLFATAKLKMTPSTNVGAQNVSADIMWVSGDVYWDPMLLTGYKHRLTLDAVVSSQLIDVKQATLNVTEIGEFKAQAAYDLVNKKPLNWIVDTKQLALAGMMQRVVKPMAANTIFGELDASGMADVRVVGNGLKPQQITLKLVGVDVTDPQNRIGVTQLNANIPWVQGESTGATLGWQSAMFGKLPLGEVRAPIALSPDAIELRKVTIPIAGGALEIDRLAMDRVENGQWPASISGRLKPISMSVLSKALGWPEMQGSLSGELPGMIYFDKTLTVNGDIKVNVFGGEIIARDLSVTEVLGRAPRLNVDVTARNLDLAMLTGTFSFGRVEGRLDGDLTDLELSAWRPVKGDIRFASSQGSYKKRISQQAVQNISALGGAGAAAAVQRSVLRFFEEFGYNRLGLSCQLRESICQMGGVTQTPVGFVIVEGGGVPAISVLGYNRRVSYTELIGRVKGAIASNQKPRIEY